jgi:hypothetical protein
VSLDNTNVSIKGFVSWLVVNERDLYTRGAATVQLLDFVQAKLKLMAMGR